MKPIHPVDQYINNNSWLIKENANRVRSYSHLKGHIAEGSIGDYAFDCYPEYIRKMHRDGWIHIHDLSNGIVPYCYGANLLKLLTKGLTTELVVSNPPKHLSSACRQIVNFLCYSQQQWAGAQALGDVNTLLAPFVWKDKLSYKDVKQEMQEIIWDFSYPSRSGAETPFINFMFNMKCPEFFEDVPTTIGEGTYGDFHDESLMILEAFNDILHGGDAIGNPFRFPIPTINLIPSMDFDSELWIKLMETEIKYGPWYWMNYLGSGINPNTRRAMCCRLSLDLTELSPTAGRWAYEGGVGSIGVVTINMAKLGYLSRDINQLLQLLDNVLEGVKEALLIKGEIINEKMIKNGFLPLLRTYNVDLDKFFRTVGLIGLNEMCENFVGLPLSEAKELVIRVMNHLREWTKRTQLETGYLWNVEKTPGEGSATRLAMVDRELHRGIITQGTDEGPYYTTLLTPPSQEMSLIDRVRVEEAILPLFTGGTVHRIYLGESQGSPVGLGKILERLAKHTKIPYMDFATTFSVCWGCRKYRNGIYEDCPDCGEKTKVYSRVVGYYQEITKYNVGKYQEFRDRTYISL